jgi:hypothetical protein
VLQDSDQDRINFKLINNLIVIPVEINGVKLSFLLDTGVSKPIIFNFLNLTEELQINQTEKIFLRGLGEGESVEALKSKNNIFKIGDAISVSQDLYAIFDKSLNFAPQLGVPIHGIMGYDLLRDFVVEINYSQKYLKLFSPDSFNPKKCRKCKVYDLEFYNNKPYINGKAIIKGFEIPMKLLMDSGSSDALWLFKDESKNIIVPKKNFDDFLGRGLSGSVYGKRSKIQEISFDDFRLKNVNVAFPDSTSITYARKFKERNGSLGGEILKRFNIIINYRDKKISLKRNRNFSDPFYYNKSGIVLEHNGVRVVKEIDKGRAISSFGSKNESLSKVDMVVSSSYKYVLAPAFTIVELRKNSPAEKIGLKLGDVVLRINGKSAHSYSLQQVTQLFFGEDGMRITLLIDRHGVQKRYKFQLKPLL